MRFLDSAPHQFFFTDKRGVGKTSLAAALTEGLAGRGLTVHLATTDPA